MQDQQIEFVDADFDNLDSIQYCGSNPLGIRRKREWLRQCLPFGLRYKTVVESDSGRTLGMIEYMPSETAWRAVQAENYYIIHCLQVPSRYRGHGLGTQLVQECLRDAQQHQKDGVAALATQHGWCADKRIYLKLGFELVDQADPGIDLLAIRLSNSATSSLADWKDRAQALGRGIFLYNSKQCPFWREDRNLQRQLWLKSQYHLAGTIIDVNDHQAAQKNPCVWGTSGIVCNGEIINYVPGGDAYFKKALRRLKMIA